MRQTAQHLAAPWHATATRRADVAALIAMA
jgi:hypothetical protein